MTGVEIGSERCSTDKHDPQANRQIPLGCGVSAELINIDGAYCGTNRDRSGFDQTLATVRVGDALVVSILDRLARSASEVRRIRL